jgi:hypothetical protein
MNQDGIDDYTGIVINASLLPENIQEMITWFEMTEEELLDLYEDPTTPNPDNPNNQNQGDPTYLFVFAFIW